MGGLGAHQLFTWLVLHRDRICPQLDGSLFTKRWTVFPTNDFVYAPSQWEMALQCNAVSHWLGAYTGCSRSRGTLGPQIWGITVIWQSSLGIWVCANEVVSRSHLNVLLNGWVCKTFAKKHCTSSHIPFGWFSKPFPWGNSRTYKYKKAKWFLFHADELVQHPYSITKIWQCHTDAR